MMTRQTPSQRCVRPGRAAAGFTLMELLMSMAILMVGIIAVAQMIPTAMRTNFRNRYDSSALIIAQRQLEQMMAQDMTVGFPVTANTAYSFVNTFLPAGTLPNATCYLGQSPPISTALPADAPPPPTLALGATTLTLADGSRVIDWSAGRVAGYHNYFTTAEGHIYETRWAVATFYGNINGYIRPVAKRIYISTRGGEPRTTHPPAQLTTMVGWRKD